MDLVKDLTKRQKEIFDFIGRYLGKHGYPPTVREIGKAVGLHSSSTVHAHLSKLEKPRRAAGATPPSRARSRSWSSGRRRPCARPACRWSARSPPARRSSPRRTSRSTSRSRRDRWRGRRLHPPGARREHEGRRHPRGGLRGRPARRARPQRRDRRRPGRRDEATVKRFFREKDHVRLQPENKTMKPIRTRDVTRARARRRGVQEGSVTAFAVEIARSEPRGSRRAVRAAGRRSRTRSSAPGRT